MALTRITGLRPYGNGRGIWEKFMSMGKAATYVKLQAWCNENGIVHPEKGKSTIAGIRFSMWKYALRNPEEAYPSYLSWQKEYGNFPTFEDFCRDVADHAYTRRSTVVSLKERLRFEEKYLGYKKTQEIS